MKPEWNQTKAWQPEYELRDGAHLIATLTFNNREGTLATAMAGAAGWTFKRVGFFQQRVSIRGRGSDTSLGEFVNATWAGGGTLSLRNGRRFTATTNFWNTKWQIEDETGRLVLRFDYGGSFRLHAVVDLAEGARDLAELSLLLTLSWYLVVMLARDAEASAGAVIITS